LGPGFHRAATWQLLVVFKGAFPFCKEPSAAKGKRNLYSVHRIPSVYEMLKLSLLRRREGFLLGSTSAPFILILASQYRALEFE
jgi:hypothetical protein